MEYKQPIGVIGAGRFGTTIANLLAENNDVWLYARRKSVVDSINETGFNKSQKIHENVEVTDDLKMLAKQCTLIFPVVPAKSFLTMIRTLAPYLRPDHIMIHGTKGFSIFQGENEDLENISRKQIKTMTELMLEETVVLRVGCLSGPNLAYEIAKGEPAATVIASRFDEVIELGKKVLKSDRFRVYGSHDVLGVELAGVLKNVLAISSGMLTGLGFGENAKAMMITRGLREMVQIGQAMGSDGKAFFGLAGIGDLIATCSSNLSRNFTVGNRLAKGEELNEILEDMEEVVEGIQTTKVAFAISKHFNLQTPIIDSIHSILFQQKSIEKSLEELMTHYLDVDVDYTW